ncbi:uncharacterized protein G2W53_003071 [Senna tora]|uniref:Uncharacterized protein n=1 Tax=Senna tora TaxID=362788 RepID=A0A834X8A4_9FABA|nr:uncharacterized protein G2W53_003071 [Senna tora]
MGLAREEEDEERPLEAVGNIFAHCNLDSRRIEDCLRICAAISFSDLLPELRWRRRKSKNDDRLETEMHSFWIASFSRLAYATMKASRT